jgi:hypothetical protein
MYENSSDYITSERELREVVEAARAQGAFKAGGKFPLPKPVKLNWQVGDYLFYTYYVSDLRGADLSDVLFAKADFRGTDFSGANLSGAVFEACNFGTIEVKENCDSIDIYPNPWTGEYKTYHTVLNGASLNGSFFKGCYLNKVEAKNLGAQGAGFEGSIITRCDFEGSSFREARFVDCDVSSSKLAHADLRGAEFSGCKLRGTKLEGAWRLATDAPVDILGQIELVMVFLAGEALAALTALTARSLRASPAAVRIIALAVLAAYLLAAFFRYRRWRKGKASKPGVGPATLMILSVEASLGLFQLVFDPNSLIEPRHYVILIWAVSLSVGAAVRYLFYEPWGTRFTLVTGRFDVTTLVYLGLPLAYTVAYMLLV